MTSDDVMQLRHFTRHFTRYFTRNRKTRLRVKLFYIVVVVPWSRKFFFDGRWTKALIKLFYVTHIATVYRYIKCEIVSCIRAHPTKRGFHFLLDEKVITFITSIAFSANTLSVR